MSVTDNERETAMASGRAVFDQELAFFTRILDQSGEAGERGLVEQLGKFSEATPDDIRRMSDGELMLIGRVAAVGMFAVHDAWFKARRP